MPLKRYGVIMKCPECGSTEYTNSGTFKSGGKASPVKIVKRYECKSCGKRFNENTAIKDEESREDKKVSTKSEWKESNKEASGTVITAIKPETLKDASTLFNVDLNTWEAERMVINSWDVTNKYGECFTNHQVKVWFKRKEFVIDLEKVAKEVNKHILPANLPKYNHVDHENLYVIDSADLHFGKLAWWEETGENYDIKIATKRFYSTLADSIKKADAFGYGRIVFAVGHDFFNADSQEDTTTKGTRVDSDVRWQKRYTLGCKLLCDAVAILRQKAPVDVIIIPGNHDAQTMFFAGHLISTKFENAEDVTVDTRPRPRKYYYWNKILLGWSHGDKIKTVDLYATMCEEASKYVGVSGSFEGAIVKEFHHGHLHHEKVQDYKGLAVRWVKSTSGTDAWHSGKGFIGSVKGLQSFLYSSVSGLECSFHSPVKIEE